ncbi:MAG TPA: hypothetical protein VLK85_30890 [Ramlibacter sp.]|nr:hypothetical protein [Ramlibacter sp.]
MGNGMLPAPIGGEIHVTVLPVGLVLPEVESGTLKAIAVVDRRGRGRRSGEIPRKEGRSVPWDPADSENVTNAYANATLAGVGGCGGRCAEARKVTGRGFHQAGVGVRQRPTREDVLKGE